jgi:hypothetical protein
MVLTPSPHGGDARESDPESRERERAPPRGAHARENTSRTIGKTHGLKAASSPPANARMVSDTLFFPGASLPFQPDA